MMRQLRAISRCIFPALITLPLAAWGQEGDDDGGPDAPEMVLEEVIVTGTSKAGQTFFTPFSANQFNEEKLESSGYRLHQQDRHRRPRKQGPARVIGPESAL